MLAQSDHKCHNRQIGAEKEGERGWRQDPAFGLTSLPGSLGVSLPNFGGEATSSPIQATEHYQGE